MRTNPSRPRSAFALTELVAVVIVSSGVVAILAASFANERRLARLGSDEANLGRLGTMTTAYAADNSDTFWTFSWRGGVTYNTPFPDLNFALSDVQAQANQAVYLLRTRAGRPEVEPIAGWIPNFMYSHFVLAEHFGTSLPAVGFISSADERRLKWAAHPKGFDQGLYPPHPSGSAAAGTNNGKRWPYSSSYQVGAAFFDASPVGMRISQYTWHNIPLVPSGAQILGRRLSAAAFPSQKVHLADLHARHFGAQRPYCTHEQARVPMLFVDGSVLVRSASESNPGWQPNQPQSPAPTAFSYLPDAWEPPTMSGGQSDPVIGRFRWTRGGLEGRDFGGPEVGP